jgi:hypothetical protein
MKAVSFTIEKILPMLKSTLKSTSNFKVKVKRQKIKIPIERSSHKNTQIWNMKALSLVIKKNMADVKVLKSTSNFKGGSSKIKVSKERSYRKVRTYTYIWNPYH